MISIIICSQYSALDPALLQNIKETIGVDYEVIHIDNSAKKYNIFQAFNLGVEQAKGEILCFMHEDVLFYTQDWGIKVENHMQDESMGALGVAGGHHVAKEMDWRFYGFGHANLVQLASTIEEKPHYYQLFAHKPQENSIATQVAVLDGVWMCIRRNLFNEIRFDDSTFHDFHLYDSDICMQVNMAGKYVYVCTDILLEHASVGTFSPSFMDSLELFFKKWDHVLPMTKGCSISHSAIEKQMAQARINYQKRFEEDALLIALRAKFRNSEGRKLSSKDFSESELKAIEKSLYKCARYTIKTKRYRLKEAWSVLMNYCHHYYAPRKSKLLYKFIWYRFIKMV